VKHDGRIHGACDGNDYAALFQEWHQPTYRVYVFMRRSRSDHQNESARAKAVAAEYVHFRGRSQYMIAALIYHRDRLRIDAKALGRVKYSGIVDDNDLA